ncbi:hypothetical protein ACLB2K_007560 [Fragaria x ananassa]
MYKLNIDGAVNLKNGRRGLGVVIRNEKGELMGASAQEVVGTFSPLVTELMALKTGLCFAIDLRTLPMVVEMDCTEAVCLINASDTCIAGEGFLAEEVKSLLKCCSASCVTFKPRECNKVDKMLRWTVSGQVIGDCVGLKVTTGYLPVEDSRETTEVNTKAMNNANVGSTEVSTVRRRRRWWEGPI